MTDDPNEIIDNAVGELYRGYYLLRKQKRYQEEYDSIGTLMFMLMQDRDHIRKTYLGNDDV
jgi:hypothetical protein